MSSRSLELAIADDLVGEPAGLGAFASVGRSAAEGLAGQALAGVGHAERTVDEDLDGKLGFVRGFGRSRGARAPGPGSPASSPIPSRAGPPQRP